MRPRPFRAASRSVNRAAAALLLAGALASLAPGCSDPDEGDRAALEAMRESSEEAARETERRACAASLLALEGERDTLDMQISTLMNDRTVDEGLLATARAAPSPDPDAIDNWQRALTQIDGELATARAARTAIEPRIDAERARCASLAADP